MRIGPQRPVNPDAIVPPPGYRVEALVTGLTFPSAISFGPGGELYLAESGGVAGTVVALPRVLRLDPDRSVNEIGRLDNPIVGLVYRQGELFIGEDGPAPRILRVTAEGEVKVLVEGLPGGGDYGLSSLSLDPSGNLLFGLGTRTNSGVVGLDNLARGWAVEHPEWADVPGADLELAGVNYVTAQPGGGLARATTGSFKPFSRRCEPGETVRGGPRSGGAVYRMPLDGGAPDRVAWGLRNPVGVVCGPDGRIFATEGGMEERGSRPIAAAPDNLWEVRPGGFYGWPDFASGVAVTDPRFRLPGHPQPRRLLASPPPIAGTPCATFPARSGVGRLDLSISPEFGFVGEALVALSGPWSLPAFAGGSDVVEGHRVVRVDLKTGAVTGFLANRHSSPASAENSGGLERPFDLRFDPTGEILYVVDAGEVQVSRDSGIEPFGGTGVLWRITRIRPTVVVPELPRETGGEEPGIAAVTSAAGEAEATEAAEPDETEATPTTEAVDETAAASAEDDAAVEEAVAPAEAGAGELDAASESGAALVPEEEPFPAPAPDEAEAASVEPGAGSTDVEFPAEPQAEAAGDAGPAPGAEAETAGVTASTETPNAETAPPAEETVSGGAAEVSSAEIEASPVTEAPAAPEAAGPSEGTSPEPEPAPTSEPVADEPAAEQPASERADDEPDPATEDASTTEPPVDQPK